MNATQELRAEHDGILLMLEILGRICNRMDTGTAVDLKHLEGIVEFLRVFADRCHHGKEEDILFPAMEKAGIPKEEGPIGEMLHDHDHGRSCIRRMNDALEKMQGGDETHRSSFIEAALEYTSLLKNHITK
jgi:hemerythrin-like domain-containing protein